MSSLLIAKTYTAALTHSVPGRYSNPAVGFARLNHGHCPPIDSGSTTVAGGVSHLLWHQIDHKCFVISQHVSRTRVTPHISSRKLQHTTYQAISHPSKPPDRQQFPSTSAPSLRAARLAYAARLLNGPLIQDSLSGGRSPTPPSGAPYQRPRWHFWVLRRSSRLASFGRIDPHDPQVISRWSLCSGKTARRLLWSLIKKSLTSLLRTR